MEKRKYKKRNIWGPRAERYLLELWAEKIGEIRSARKNGHIFKEMASLLQKNEINVTGEEVKSKIQNLSTKYRNEKSITGISGGSPSNWEYYSAVHQILGKFKINNVETLVEDSLLCEELPSGSHTIENSLLCEELPSGSQTIECGPSILASSPRSLSPVELPDASQMSSESSSTMTSSASNSARKRKQSFQVQLLKKMDSMESRIEKQCETMVDMEKKMVETDNRNSDLFEKLVKSNIAMNSAFIEYLKEKN